MEEMWRKAAMVFGESRREGPLYASFIELSHSQIEGGRWISQLGQPIAMGIQVDCPNSTQVLKVQLKVATLIQTQVYVKSKSGPSVSPTKDEIMKVGWAWF